MNHDIFPHYVNYDLVVELYVKRQESFIYSLTKWEDINLVVKEKRLKTFGWR